jgi:arylsulfatase A-like enzyme
LAKPNILLILSDQHRFDCLGVNRHPFLRTPHIDRLAAEGVNFTQAHTPIPVCVPTRNSLLHGQWSTEHLAIANHDTEAPRPAKPGLPTFTRMLHDAGYALLHVGKWGVHPDKDPTHPDYGYDRYISVGDYPGWREGLGAPPLPKTTWEGGVDPGVGPELSRLAWGAGETIRLLEQVSSSTQPFFIRWDPSEPHLPNIVPEPYNSLYPPEEISPWPSFPDPLIGKPYIQGQQRRTWGVEGWSWAQWAPVVSRYLGQISLLDAQVGRLLDALNTLGLVETTLVIYTADHGDLGGGHGMVDKHYVMYDDVVRVPLVARWPGHISPGTHCDAFVSHSLDLASTFCDVAGIPAPATFRGQSLVPLFKGAQDNGRSDIFSMYHGNQFGLYSQRMVRDRQWKYVWNATAEDELYDLEHDPGELWNLVTNPAYLEELRRLRRRLIVWMEAISDPLLNHWNRTQLLEDRTL